MIVAGTLALASRGRLSILIFHRVMSERDAMLPGEPTAAEFDALLEHVKARFTVLPLANAVQRLYDGALPRAALAITFDDGYADNLNVAAPLLQKHALPATLFVATGYLDGGIMWNDLVIAAFRSTRLRELDLASLGLGTAPTATLTARRAGMERVLRELKYRPPAERERLARAVADAGGIEAPGDLMLTRHGIRELARYGVDVGAHTVTHPILARVDQATAWREITEGKREAEDIVGRAVPLFAYPNGRPGDDYGVEHVRMVREAGFAAAVSTAWGAADRASDRMQLPRFTPWTRKPLRFDLLMLRNLRHRAGADGPAVMAR